MPVIDEERGVLVVRIVYDGPALSGKTTSLKSLAGGVSSQITTPGEANGRTLFFDWVDYIGGAFDGRQIRCQIVSVPGQRELQARRQALLETADAVVLVLDTRQHEWDFSLDWVKQTVPYCRGKDPPVGLVLQANKRDAADAVPWTVLRESVNSIAPVAIVPSTATAGDGIREAFVLAVRLALDRVRVLAGAGRLLSGKPAQDSPEELLSHLRDLEPESSGPTEQKQALAASAASAITAELDAMEARHIAGERERSNGNGIGNGNDNGNGNAHGHHETENVGEKPFVPDPMMPGGMIWPPVDGRALLHEVASLDIQPTRVGRADWAGSGSGFRFHSLASAVFPDMQSARNELIEWARQHAANLGYLSTGRAVILADAGGGRLRLWQIVRAEATLRERLAAALPLGDPGQVAEELLRVATQLAAAREYFTKTTIPLPCNLWTVGAQFSSRPMFVGLMPARDNRVPPEPTGRELLLRELSPQLRELRRSRVDYEQVVSRLLSAAELATWEAPARWLSEIVFST